MRQSPPTRPSLLIRLRDGQDDRAWGQFVDIYAPLVFAYARKHDLQDADAADLTQEVLRSVAGAIRRLDYDRRRGTFRGWLLTITRNALRKHWARGDRQPRGAGGTGMQQRLEEHPAAADEAFWHQEYQRRLFRWAAERIESEFRPGTWQAFWQSAVNGRPPKEVADELGLSLGAVYTAKSRVLARLREEVERLGCEDPPDF